MKEDTLLAYFWLIFKIKTMILEDFNEFLVKEKEKKFLERKQKFEEFMMDSQKIIMKVG